MNFTEKEITSILRDLNRIANMLEKIWEELHDLNLKP